MRPKILDLSRTVLLVLMILVVCVATSAVAQNVSPALAAIAAQPAAPAQAAVSAQSTAPAQSAAPAQSVAPAPAVAPSGVATQAVTPAQPASRPAATCGPTRARPGLDRLSIGHPGYGSFDHEADDESRPISLRLEGLCPGGGLVGLSSAGNRSPECPGGDDRPSGHEHEAVEGPRAEPLRRQTAAELSRIWQRPPGLRGQALVARLALTAYPSRVGETHQISLAVCTWWVSPTLRIGLPEL